MGNLLESFAKRVKLAEAVYNKNHSDETMSYDKKVMVAKVLDNTSKLLKEALGGVSATQRADLQTQRRFCIDITNVAIANLIASDLVLTKAMPGRTGVIEYVKFVSGTEKGDLESGTLFNSPFKFGETNQERINYTSAAVTESHTVTSGEASAHAVTLVPTWTPFVAIKAVVVDGINYAIVAAGSEVADTSCSVNDKTVTFATADTHFVNGKVLKYGYLYDNAYIHANQIPSLKAVRSSIALEAKPRRIAVEYSQLAAFEYKEETGVDLGEALKNQAVAEMTYEIDCEIVNMLFEGAKKATTTYGDSVSFNKTVPYGISKAEHYEAFAEVIAQATQVIYDRTKKFNANYMVCASNIKPMFSLMKGWKAADNSKQVGPYYAGSLDGLKVYVSPIIPAGKFFLGFNGNDLATSAGVYAPWMGLVPTQLLQFADGTTSQGYAVMYDAKILNDCLLVEGTVEEVNRVVYTSAI